MPIIRPFLCESIKRIISGFGLFFKGYFWTHLFFNICKACTKVCNRVKFSEEYVNLETL